MNRMTFDCTVVPALGDLLGFVPAEIDFGTRNINARTERESSGGCDTCNFYYDVGYITVDEVTRWPGVL